MGSRCFGLAKQLTLDAEITATGEIFGTPYYMSPEQGHGREVDARSDVYSLGVIFYEMLTGKKPYLAPTPMAVIYKHSHAPIPTLPEDLAPWQRLLEKLLAKEPHDRYQSAAEICAAIDAHLAAEAPAGNAPAGTAPAGTAPAGDAPAGNAPAGDAPAGNAPTGNAPAGNAPAGNAPAGNAPAGNAPAGNAPAGDAPAGNAPAGNAPAGDAPTGNAPAGNAPSP